MKITLPVIVLVIAVLGCGRFGTGSGSNAGTNDAPKTNSTPAAPVKAFDMPSLVDKSRDEVKKIMNVTPKSEDPWLEYDLPQGYLTIWYTKGKQSHLSFDLKSIQVGSQTASGFASPEQLGDLVGIDVHGKPLPTENGGFYKYEGLNLNGKPRNVTFHKVGNGFSGVSVDFD